MKEEVADYVQREGRVERAGSPETDFGSVQRTLYPCVQ